MNSSDLKTWINSKSNDYLKMYTGIQTDRGIERFRDAFKRFLNLYTGEFGSVRLAIVEFIDYRNQIKAKRAA